VTAQIRWRRPVVFVWGICAWRGGGKTKKKGLAIAVSQEDDDEHLKEFV
jgi:hypothetical protein